MASPSVRTLPANRSYVFADSVYAEEGGDRRNPYDFTCNLSGGLVGKEIIYSTIYWNQPIFSHNRLNNELRFQINGVTSTTYIIYVTPFLMFNQYDGNPVGTSYLTPQTYSYASNVELALNGDVRTYPNNVTLINGGTGILKDADGHTMHPQFRYSPSRGFVFTFAPSTNNNIPVYTVKLLPCSFISGAHFVHGFGINSNDSSDFIPRDEWTPAYFSDDTPTLLPFRYIVVSSNEITKERVMPSFQNASSTKTLNEIAIFELNSNFTASYHTKTVGNDATVISKRDDYQPQKIRIRITNEDGKTILPGDPLRSLLGNSSVSLSSRYSFLPNSPTSRQNRGDHTFTNWIVFGEAAPSYSGDYIEVDSKSPSYPFGNPYADALGEDLIHELFVVLESN